MSVLKKLINLGNKPEFDDTLRRHIEISNFIALIYVVLTIPFLILNISHPYVMLVRSLPIWASISAWILMALGWHRLSRFVIATSFPVMIYIMGVLLLIDDGTNGMAPKFWFIGSASIPFLVFDYKERKYIIASLILLLILYFTFDTVNAKFDLPGLTDNLDKPQMRRMAGAGAIIMISSITFYVKKQLFDRNRELEEKAKELENKNQELTAAEEELKQNFEELTVLNDQLFTQKNTLEKVLKDLQSSIRYAKSIQKAILLPRQEILRRNFSDYMIYFKPREEIGGDFYYFYERGDKIILTLGDSTGHGVPGALMSVLGIALLNETFLDSDLTKPSQILNRLREKIIEYLHQNQTMLQDGYDMAIACFDKKNKILTFTSAHLSLYIIRDGEIIEFKGSRMPVGKFHKQEPFTDTEIQLKSGDLLYSFTDGFADQFGGPQYKKFGKQNLIKVLKEISSFPLSEQNKILDNILKEWKGDNKQTDDITVIGIRVGEI